MNKWLVCVRNEIEAEGGSEGEEATETETGGRGVLRGGGRGWFGCPSYQSSTTGNA